MLRDLKECQAEVFRRSEKRIKERKRKRNCMLACGIPLCLLLIVGVVRLPELLTPVDESLGVEKTVRIEITDAEQALALQNSIFGFYEASDKDSADAEQSSTGTDVGSVVESDKVLFGSSAGTQDGDLEQYLDIKATAQLTYKYGASAEQKEQVFSFCTEDGTEFEFRLKGNTLYDVKNDTEIELSDEQLDTLKTILGLEE